MEKKILARNIIVAFLVAMLLVLLVIVAYYSENPPPKMLYPGEIRDYRGQNLASIADVRENAIKGTQFINISTYHLEITGLVNQTLDYTYDQVVNNFQKYQKVLTLFCVEGWSTKILWEGFLVSDLIKEARVNSSAVGVIFYASDGYSTELPLDYITNNSILLSYKMNGLVIPPERGFPFQLVAESQYGYKWIKWVTKIELSDNPNYLGFWESRGYPNNATIR
ncbi:MAG TPA: molybdopterin-dependent oxidoreductase [Candidatus Binatia bacterium]|nr:molybdopterin-dependent oxidoreductase [Candidatus Binatia bacterium]